MEELSEGIVHMSDFITLFSRELSPARPREDDGDSVTVTDGEFLHLSDFLQLRTDLHQLQFAVVQPGLEPLVLVQSLRVHLATGRTRGGGDGGDGGKGIGFLKKRNSYFQDCGRLSPTGSTFL